MSIGRLCSFTRLLDNRHYTAPSPFTLRQGRQDAKAAKMQGNLNRWVLHWGWVLHSALVAVNRERQRGKDCSCCGHAAVAGEVLHETGAAKRRSHSRLRRIKASFR